MSELLVPPEGKTWLFGAHHTTVTFRIPSGNDSKFLKNIETAYLEYMRFYRSEDVVKASKKLKEFLGLDYEPLT